MAKSLTLPKGAATNASILQVLFRPIGATVMGRLSAVLFLVAAFSACGPVQSTANLLDAEVQLQAAKTAGAEKYAPYEWTSANLYIRKAREEVGYSDFEAGVEFARKASKYANEARDRAMNAVKTDTLPSSPSP